VEMKNKSPTVSFVNEDKKKIETKQLSRST
jgi:hypothetical protein